MKNIKKYLETMKSINAQHRRISTFSKRLAWCNTIIAYASQFNLQGIIKRENRIKDDIIISYLERDLHNIIAKAGTYESQIQIEEDSKYEPIWLCWWTGEDSAPKVVKQCIKSIRKHANNHPVYMVTKDNVENYVDIPQYIRTKVDNGEMCLANFSDWLRFSLLEKWGGLWMDVTIYCSDEIPDSCFSDPLFTCKLPVKYGEYVSNYQWTSFCIGGKRGHALFGFFKDCFEEYWRKHDLAIDYLLVDYIIYIATKYNDTIRSDMSNVLITNLHRHSLQNAMRKNVISENIDEFIYEDTWLNKLSWHEGYAENVNEKQTVYGYFLNMDI